MFRSELDYHLPPELIAQHPCEPRDAARLLVLHRESGRIEHRVVRDITEYLRRGDCLVLNDTRVIPARFFCRRGSGGRIEALFIHAMERPWHVLLRPSARLRVGERLMCDNAPVELEIVARGDRGEWTVTPHPPIEPLELLHRIGAAPLPPYIARAGAPAAADAADYQTVYAARPGAVAAPTAGMHFTPELLCELGRLGVARADVTLHVGPGTFFPIEVDDLARHKMHAEWFEMGDAAAGQINAIHGGAGRVVAVGTTAARVLESCGQGPLAAQSGWTTCFIYPPYRFRRVDVLLTNFHLPQSTLLALVMALAGIERTREAYRVAVGERYRFFSYGDAMLIV